MILEDRTLAVLKNFASINPSIQFKQGSTLSTISPQKTVMAKARLNQEFSRTFAIYDVSRFLGVLSLFGQPEIETDNDQYLTIKEGRQKVKYMFTDPGMIAIPPEKKITLPSVDVAFTMTAADFTKTMKALAIMQMSEIAVAGDGSLIAVKTIDTKGAVQDSFAIEVGETDQVFTAVFRADNLKLMISDYDVRISRHGLASFAASDGSLEYWIACESSSSFN